MNFVRLPARYIYFLGFGCRMSCHLKEKIIFHYIEIKRNFWLISSITKRILKLWNIKHKRFYENDLFIKYSVYKILQKIFLHNKIKYGKFSKTRKIEKLN